MSAVPPPPQPEPQAPYPPAYPTVYAVRPPTNPLAVVSLIGGILGLVVAWIPWAGLVLGAIGVVFGHIALSQIGRSVTPQSGKGLAISGLITGYVAVAANILWIVVLAWFTSSLSNAFAG